MTTTVYFLESGPPANSLQLIVNPGSVGQMIAQDRTYDSLGNNNAPGKALLNCINGDGK
jgi:hypothetical protein